MTDFDTLLAEYASMGVGPALYALFLNVVRAIIRGRGYPTSYSPTGRWDEDALSGLAHDWIADKLLERGHLDHLLLANINSRGLRRGLELSFVDYLLTQRAKTAIDHLFRRANFLFESHSAPIAPHPIFRLVRDAPKKAIRVWGLEALEGTMPYDGADDDLIAAGFRVKDVTVIRYRDSAQKLSPVLSDADLLVFLQTLLHEVGWPLALAQVMIVLRYRFDLLAAPPLSLDAPLEDVEHATLGDIVSGPDDVAAAVEIDSLVDEVLQSLTPRQGQVLLAYAQPGATLTSVAVQFACSKSTIDNELRRAMQAIRDRAETAEEAGKVYRQLVTTLDATNEEGGA